VDAGSLDKLRAQQLPLEMVQLLFLPEEVERVQAVVDGLGRLGGGEAVRYAARLADFDRFFEALLKVKEVEGIVNSATAVLRMVEIVEAHLADESTNSA
jgi:hypothetical protein